MKKLLIGIVLFPLFVSSQSLSSKTDSGEGGIRFDSSQSWKEVLSKAKIENKLIFVDCYATWCGPCKWMAMKVFSLREVGDFFNSKFINIALQFDKTKGDNQYIRDWYNDVDSIRDRYLIGDYPTYLFFSPTGEIIHRFEGSTATGQDLIAKANKALDPVTQIYTRVARWQSYINDTAELWNLYLAAREIRDYDQAKRIAEAYLNAQKNLFSKKNLLLISGCGLLKTTRSAWFQFYLSNSARIDDSLDGSGGVKHFSAWALRPAIVLEELQPLYNSEGPISWLNVAANIELKYSRISEGLLPLVRLDFEYHIRQEVNRAAIESGKDLPNWKEIDRRLMLKYPEFDFQKTFLQGEASYDAYHKEWSECIKSALALVQKYGSELDNTDLNNIAWDYVFLHSNNRKALMKAQKWMKKVIDGENPNRNFIDTYANLTYKLGERKEALLLETKLVEGAIRDRDRSAYLQGWQNNLKNMQEGKPTWSEEGGS